MPRRIVVNVKRLSSRRARVNGTVIEPPRRRRRPKVPFCFFDRRLSKRRGYEGRSRTEETSASIRRITRLRFIIVMFDVNIIIRRLLSYNHRRTGVFGNIRPFFPYLSPPPPSPARPLRNNVNIKRTVYYIIYYIKYIYIYFF